MALNFPTSPTNGQIYYDTSSGNRYIYDSANTIWVYAANSSLYLTSNTQILFNNQQTIGGSNSLTWQSNTLNAENIVVTKNVSAQYYFGNGSFLTGVSTTVDLTPANNWANTLYTSALQNANNDANSSNSYAITVGAASNNYANVSFYTIANGAIAFTQANGSYINANNAANSANAYTVTVGAAANTFATSQDNNVRAFANSTANSANIYGMVYANGVANSANAYTVTVGAASNTWANSTFYTIANGAVAFAAANGAYINANNAANSANAYAVTVGAAGNTAAYIFANGVANSANAYTVTVGAAANTWANTKLTNGSVTLAGSLFATGTVTANSYVYITAIDSAGNEGGEIQLAGAAGANYTSWSIDAYQNNYRVFARTGTSVSNVNFFHAIGGGSVRMGVNKTDPAYTVDVSGDVNITGTYRVNGTPISSGTTDLTPANNYSNTLYTSALQNANGSANSANAYAVTVGAAGNTYAMVYANGVANSANSGKVTSVTGTAGQIFSSGGTTPTLNLINTAVVSSTYGGTSQIPVFTVDGQGRLTYAANVSVSAMDYAYVNATANSLNTVHYIYANGVANSANAYAVTVGAASNTWANTKLANTSGVSFDGDLYFPTGKVGIGNTTPALKLEVAGNMSVDAFIENSINIATSYTITSGRNAMSAGPITINTGVTVTVPSGSTWTIV